VTPWPYQESVSPDTQSAPVELSRFVTACFGVIFLACLGFLVFAHLSMPRLDRIPSPERALEIITNQVMGLQDGLNQVSDLERQVMSAVDPTGEELQQCIEWYSELIEINTDPRSAFYLAILEGEAGQTQSVQMKVHMWKDWALPFPFYSEVLQAAYLLGEIDSFQAQALQAQIAEQIPSGWFYRRVALHLAERSHDEELQATLKAASQRHAQRLVSNNRLLGIAQIIAVMGGFMAMVMLGRRWKWGGAAALRVGEVSLPPRWSGGTGLVVLIRGGGIASLLIISLSVTGLDPSALQFLIPISIHIPILGLAYYYLWRPNGLSIREAVGLNIMPGGWTRIVWYALMLFTLGVGGGWVIGLVAQNFETSLHWTDWFDPTMIQGTTWALIPPLLSYTILAPLFEELVFRGVLYSSLRRYWNAPMAMVVSALIFSLAHGYGAFGLITIFWSGLLWAWAYEKTGSILPGMAAHALNNSLVCATVLLLVRPG
jgi:CAAX protease family protein